MHFGHSATKHQSGLVALKIVDCAIFTALDGLFLEL